MEHKVVSHDEWMAARKKHLADEKEFTHRRDRLSQARRDLPWERITKEYLFEGPTGRVSLSDLFDGRSQLVIYHAMFNPDTATPETSWTTDAACQFCSFWIDNFDRIAVHLNHRDITILVVSRARYPKIVAYKRRMGWTIPYVSSVDSDFNVDFGVSFTPEEVAAGKADCNYGTIQHRWTEAPGISVFIKDDQGIVYHTYSTYARGIDMLNVAYHYMDLVPKGRDEGDGPMRWLRRHDEYKDRVAAVS
jgi:predicted dithiol-disulfide oxidoreductase (DUF899 family)